MPADDGATRAIVEAFAAPVSLLGMLPAVLAHRDVCSRVSVYQRYDGVVRGCTSLPPGAADAGVLVPIPGAPLGVAVGLGGNPRYGKIDARRAGALAVVEAIAQVTAVGATPAGLTDCLNFGDPTIPSQMGAFVAAVEGLAETARALQVPFVSGNVSLYNRSSSGKHVAPSPIVSCIGTLADVSVAPPMGFKRPNSPVVVLTHGGGSFGGTVVADVLGVEANDLGTIDLEWFGRASACVREAMERGVVLSARDLSDGGLLVAAAEMALASSGGIGLRIGGPGVATAAARAALFAESPGYVLEIGDFTGFLTIAERYRLPIRLDMQTSDEPFVEHLGEQDALVGRIALDDLRRVWEAPLRDFYGPSAGAA